MERDAPVNHWAETEAKYRTPRLFRIGPSCDSPAQSVPAASALLRYKDLAGCPISCFGSHGMGAKDTGIWIVVSSLEGDD